jgi:DNA-directed RNA polymerase subunit M/transcription elongation factor TFIIS
MEKETISKRCKKCSSTLTYIKFGTMERICRNCGHIEKLKKNKSQEQEEIKEEEKREDANNIQS